MNTQLKKDQQNQPGKQSSTRSEPFDFDQWAVEVRRQLLASLQKRTGR